MTNEYSSMQVSKELSCCKNFITTLKVYCKSSIAYDSVAIYGCIGNTEATKCCKDILASLAHARPCSQPFNVDCMLKRSQTGVYMYEVKDLLHASGS